MGDIRTGALFQVRHKLFHLQHNISEALTDEESQERVRVRIKEIEMRHSDIVRELMRSVQSVCCTAAALL